MSRLTLMIKALRELGPRQLGLYAWYRIQLKTGYLHRKTAAQRSTPIIQSIQINLLKLPDPNELHILLESQGVSQLLSEANQIVDGHVHLFGADPVALELTPPGMLSHWTDYERGNESIGSIDIKYIWEPARFGWSFTLGRAYHLTGDERYPECFWRFFEKFHETNPVNRGLNWVSAQEVAIRLMAFVFASQIFSTSHHSTTSRISQLALSIAQHASRIPLSLIYARAQNNNHLLSEAAGLITASLALPDHPESPKWSKLGWKWLNHGLETQISEDGTYMQQSTNYHRLMLQLVLWISAIQGKANSEKQRISERATLNIQRAIQWLFSLTDTQTGRVPNLGPNDGAYILPLAIAPFHDYRPVLQAASQAFLGKPAFKSGRWDEMSQWIALRSHLSTFNVQPTNIFSTLHAARSWAYFRVARFHDRPGHADQLHLDLWWRGLNVAQDAGTYLYNADPPWENALTHTAVHNTVMVDGLEQMTRAGRFLYLDRAQAEIDEYQRAEDGAWEKIIARHDGYRRLGIVHQRTVTAHLDDHWIVEDQLLPTPSYSLSPSHSVRLHWLLPDWEWKIDNSGLKINLLSPCGWVSLNLNSSNSNYQSSIIRAGEILYGELSSKTTWGWVSPTYGEKRPALSFSVSVKGTLPIKISSEWIFPPDE